MRNFVGLENANTEVRKAMLDFAYHLTIGNLDEAFKAIKLIKRYLLLDLAYYIFSLRRVLVENVNRKIIDSSIYNNLSTYPV